MFRKLLLSFTLILFSFAVFSCQKEAENQNNQKKLFGKLSDGKEVFMYTISNGKGVSAEIINLGAIVVSLKAPDRNGVIQDVILGFDSLADYEKDKSFQGAIVGRYGNRIGQAKFSIDGTEYQVTKNEGENQLHGGVKGFYKAYWNAEQINDSTLKLTLESPDGDEGYPGNVKMTVTYSITADNEFRIDYSGTTDKPTILNPTNHCYYNLTGSPENTILNHELMIAADKFTPVDTQLITTGELWDVAGTPMDFLQPTKIGKNVGADYEQLLIPKGYDHNWVLNDYSGNVRLVASLYDSLSGRFMELFTDRPGLQFYSGNFLDGTMTGKGGIKYNHRTGLCLETQAYPDSPNKPDFPSVILRPGEEYKQTTIHRFSVK